MAAGKQANVSSKECLGERLNGHVCTALCLSFPCHETAPFAYFAADGRQRWTTSVFFIVVKGQWIWNSEPVCSSISRIYAFFPLHVRFRCLSLPTGQCPRPAAFRLARHAQVLASVCCAVAQQPAREWRTTAAAVERVACCGEPAYVARCLAGRC